MINVEELGARIILGFGEGKLFITESTLSVSYTHLTLPTTPYV